MADVYYIYIHMHVISPAIVLYKSETINLINLPIRTGFLQLFCCCILIAQHGNSSDGGEFNVKFIFGRITHTRTQLHSRCIALSFCLAST